MEGIRSRYDNQKETPSRRSLGTYCRTDVVADLRLKLDWARMKSWIEQEDLLCRIV